MRARCACQTNARLSSLSAHTSYMQHVATVCVSGKYSLGLISVIPMFYTTNNVNWTSGWSLTKHPNKGHIPNNGQRPMYQGVRYSESPLYTKTFDSLFMLQSSLQLLTDNFTFLYFRTCM